MAYIHVFQGNVSANAVDGLMVSEGTKENPIITAEIDATFGAETRPIKLALRVDAGYVTSGETKLQAVGESAKKWAFASDQQGEPGGFLGYGEPFILKEPIGNANKVFWLKARASADEQPQADSRVTIAVKSNIVFEL
jgi:hypothetical protein